MPNHLPLFLLYTAAVLTTATALHHLSSLNSSSPAPSPATSITQPPPPPSTTPPPPLEYMQQQQIKNILDALIGTGDFAAWANILFNPISSNSSIPTTTTTTTLPTTATFFVPGNDALSRLSATTTGAYSFDPFIIPYHVLPQRLTFSDLQLFKPHTRLPTLLPSKTILITDNAPTHFTIDDALIVHPDIYSNAAVCVHGIESVFDYRVYGEPDRSVPASFPPPPLPPLTPVDETWLSPPTPEVVSSVGVVFFVGFLIQLVGIVLILYEIS